jgi:hypothetical protein
LPSITISARSAYIQTPIDGIHSSRPLSRNTNDSRSRLWGYRECDKDTRFGKRSTTCAVRDGSTVRGGCRGRAMVQQLLPKCTGDCQCRRGHRVDAKVWTYQGTFRTRSHDAYPFPNTHTPTHVRIRAPSNTLRTHFQRRTLTHGNAPSHGPLPTGRDPVPMDAQDWPNIRRTRWLKIKSGHP